LLEKFTQKMLPLEISVENLYDMSDNIDTIQNGQILEFVKKHYAPKVR
jgi:hypothetical protein